MKLTTLTLARRGLCFHWRAGLAVMLGAAIGTAALTGALVVGDSMRASLHELALARLGPVEFALSGGRFFREALAGELAADARLEGGFGAVCPMIRLSAAMEHPDSDSRVNRVQVLGVDARFWNLYELPAHRDGEHTGKSAEPSPMQRQVTLNEPLAEALGAKVGDDVLLRFERPSQVPTETLLGRREDTVATLRLTVGRIIPGEGPGALALEPGQLAARNAYVPLDLLQRNLKQVDRVNTLLVTAYEPDDLKDANQHGTLTVVLRSHLKPEDVELRFRMNESLGYLTVESTRLLLEPPLERAVIDAAGLSGLKAVPILTYLANAITVNLGDASESKDFKPRSIPYSTVSAIDWDSLPSHAAFKFTDGSLTGRSQSARGAGEAGEPGDILLNEWAARDLDAKADDTITLTYFVSRPGGQLEEIQAAFRLTGIVQMTGWGGDPDLTPTYEGITDARRVSDWDPPFPFDMKRIRSQDETYWDEHRALPKAFLQLAEGRRLWGEDHERFGSLTSIRLCAEGGAITRQAAERFSAALMQAIRPEELGLQFDPVRMQAIAAGGGSTDFGGLFIGFSSFLIITAAILVALMFRLAVERRASQIGLLLAVGCNARRVSRLLLLEGGVLALAGALLGLALAGGYAWLMLAGLRGWWSAAVNAPFLRLAATPTSVAIGLLAGLLIALWSISWSVRGLTRNTTRSLLAGVVAAQGSHRESNGGGHRRRLIPLGLLAIGLLSAISLSLASLLTETMPQAVAFFLAGFAMLVALLAAVQLWLVRTSTTHGPGPIRLTTGWLAVRNARRQPLRSLLSTGLVASATFVIVAVGASRKSPDADAATRAGGTGGYALMAETEAALPYDPGTADGRASLGLAAGASATGVASKDDANSRVDDTSIMAFRLRPGDDSSCLNLYKVRQPRILGARASFIERGGFRFAGTLAHTEQERANPWVLLHHDYEDGAIPAIGDESSVRWLLHLGLGDDLVISDERGREMRLRIVGMLAGSILQSELVIAESHFVQRFPSRSGYSVMLIDAPPARIGEVKAALAGGLRRYGVEITETRARLAEYLAVENTYLSTFQSLGGLGLLLGTIGLAAVTLRNVWERRGELALLRALGLRDSQLFRMTLLEHIVVLACGLAVGTISAAIAVGPHLWSSPGDIPLQSLTRTLLVVFVFGAAVGAVSIRSTLAAPLLPALRRE